MSDNNHDDLVCRNVAVAFDGQALAPQALAEGLPRASGERGPVEEGKLVAEPESKDFQAAKQIGPALGLFAAGVVDEINQPNHLISLGVQNACVELNTFHLFLRDILDEESEPELLDIFDQYIDKITAQHLLIEEGSRRISSIMNGLKIVTEMKDENQHEAVITDVLLDAVRTTQAFHSNLLFDLRVDRCPVSLCWPDELKLIFIGILENAVLAINERGQSMPGHQGRVGVDARWGNGCLSISFSDNGTGMPPEVLDKVFDPFFTTRSVLQGVGLGLSVARDVILKHDGSIRAESERGEGTRILLQLPLSSATKGVIVHDVAEASTLLPPRRR